MIKKAITFYKNIIGKPLCLWKKRDFKRELKEIAVLDVELVGHCNLNCKCCTHFSPLMKQEELSTELLEKDFTQLKKVFGNAVKRINLLGGEPLLHSDICACMKISRKIFSDQEIVIVTNGILLLRESDTFWKLAKDLHIKIEVTKYPISFDYQAVKELAIEKDVDFKFYGRSGYVQKTQYHLPLDCSGRQDKEKSYENCFMARHCFTLKEGKIYPCSYAAFIERFNSAFKKEIPITSDDYGDIYVETKEAILRKIGKAVPMCSYCDVKNRSYGNAWGTSKREIEEWT